MTATQIETRQKYRPGLERAKIHRRPTITIIEAAANKFFPLQLNQ